MEYEKNEKKKSLNSSLENSFKYTFAITVQAFNFLFSYMYSFIIIVLPFKMEIIFLLFYQMIVWLWKLYALVDEKQRNIMNKVKLCKLNRDLMQKLYLFISAIKNNNFIYVWKNVLQGFESVLN